MKYIYYIFFKILCYDSRATKERKSMFKNKVLLLSVILLAIFYSGCTPKLYKVNPKFAEILTKKREITLIVPDVHKVELGLMDTVELSNQTEEAVKIFTDVSKEVFSQTFTFSEIKGEHCPFIVTDKNETNATCVSEIFTFRNIGDKIESKLADNNHTMNNIVVSDINLSNKTDLTFYIFALEPTRTAAEATKDILVSTAFGLLFGVMPVKTVRDTLLIAILDNKTNKMLWYGTVLGETDINDKEVIRERMLTLYENMLIVSTQ